MLSDTAFCHLVINMVKKQWKLQQKQKWMLQKLLLKELFKKTAEAAGDSIRNKIADQIISMGALKEKPKKVEGIYISQKKR